LPSRQTILIASTLVATAALQATLEILSVREESQTWDEGIEIASGYSYLKTGEYRIAPEHPPLARIIAAIPLLPLNLRVPVDDPSWSNGDAQEFGFQFVYHNLAAPDRILFAARLPFILITALFEVGLAAWTWRAFSPWAALGAVAFFAFDPNVAAHARYAKHDVLLAAFCFLCVALWGTYLKSGKRRWLLAAGMAFGLALATKFSALFLVLVLPVTWILTRWQQRRPLAPLRCVVAMSAVLTISAAMLLIVYLPATGKLIPATRSYRIAHPEARRVGDVLSVLSSQAKSLMRIGTQLGLQDHPLLTGFTVFLDHASYGHQEYLLGRVSQSGWWYYFPVAFLVKTPVATLAAILIAVCLAIWRLMSSPPGWLRSQKIPWLLLAAPIVVYVPLCIANRVNVGERHLLPAYPFAFVLTAAVLTRDRWKARVPVLVTLAAVLIGESAAVYPHYLTFFNFAAGGPAAGPRYLLDSNIDWGQDFKRLARYVESNRIPRVCLFYFGNVDPSAYGMDDAHGVQILDVPATRDIAARSSSDCIIAISATPLFGLYVEPGQFDWLHQRNPDTTIGHSIYIYDLRKKSK